MLTLRTLQSIGNIIKNKNRQKVIEIGMEIISIIVVSIILPALYFIQIPASEPGASEVRLIAREEPRKKQPRRVLLNDSHILSL